MPEVQAIDALAKSTFTEAKLELELTYVTRPASRTFERPYGWAWILYLHHEAERQPDLEWSARLKPLAQSIAARFRDYLEVLLYPIHSGTHSNTAFALVLAREWAEARDAALLEVIDRWSIAAYQTRRSYNGWEPSGDDFLSPVLIAALLLSRVMPSNQFTTWFERLVLDNGWLERECVPVTVADRSDGKIVHLDGLNLSRAWCLFQIIRLLDRHTCVGLLEKRAQQHIESSVPYVQGDYMGEHWLASFALLAMLSRK